MTLRMRQLIKSSGMQIPVKAISIIITIINSETSSNGIYSFDSYSASVGLVLIILNFLVFQKRN